MEPRKAAIMQALDRFVAQRPGLEFGNYGDVSTYRSEMRGITRDRHDYNVLARAVERSDSITADMLIKAAQSAYSGRLSIFAPAVGSRFERQYETSNMCKHCGQHHGKHTARDHDGGAPRCVPEVARVDYVTGQYFPTEYRKAATAILASVLWEHVRENCMPIPCNHDQDDSPLYSDSRSKVVVSAGDWLRAYFRREFGRSIANRWFQ